MTETEKHLKGYTFHGRRIPEYMHSGLIAYIERHEEPGGFLRAVLENDLGKASAKADGSNLFILPVYANFLYNFAPSSCHGSPEKVKNWLAKHPAHSK